MENVIKPDEVIQQLPFKAAFQGKIYLFCALAYMFDSFDIMLPGFAIPLLAKSDWQVSTVQLGLLGTMGLIGMAVGALIGGSLSDVHGRKNIFISSVFVYSLFTVLCAFSTSYSMLLGLRLIAGLGLGALFPVNFTVLAEFMPLKYRGRLISSMSIWFSLGAVTAGLVALHLLAYGNSWRPLFLTMIVPAILAIFIAFGLPESPMFLIKKGEVEKAKKILEKILRKTGESTGNWDLTENCTENNVESKRDLQQETVRNKGFLQKYKGVWEWNWRITLAVWLSFAFLNFLYYTILTWTPKILVASGYSTSSAFVSATLMTILMVVGSTVAMVIVDFAGRKPLILCGGIVCAVAAFLFIMLIEMPLGAKLMLGLFGFSMQIAFPAMYTWGSEVYPTLIRGTSWGLASTISRATSAFAPFLLGAFLWPTLGLQGTFVLIGILVIVAVLAVQVWGPETKGKKIA